ncbi:hypothetical protein HUJ05_003343 [Dendroctonus ponderosae]|nr:hypothetical protein HUJ05_003343 [Dendroctonus ponderosae]
MSLRGQSPKRGFETHNGSPRHDAVATCGWNNLRDYWNGDLGMTRGYRLEGLFSRGRWGRVKKGPLATPLEDIFKRKPRARVKDDPC